MSADCAKLPFIGSLNQINIAVMVNETQNNEFNSLSPAKQNLLDKVIYDGGEYYTRQLNKNGAIISTENLSDLLINESGYPVNDAAEILDNSIFYYVENLTVLTMPEAKLWILINANI